jgi:pSer/pThr/pTyr-binding forkhead associated (FHA) protein
VFLNGAVTIGKLDTNDCVIVRPVASRVHAEVDLAGDGAVVKDLGSKNGTFVDGNRLQPQVKTVVGPGARVSLAKEVDLGFRSAVEPDGRGYVLFMADQRACLLLRGRVALRDLGRDTDLVLAGDEGILGFVYGSQVMAVDGTRRYSIGGLSIEVEVKDA